MAQRPRVNWKKLDVFHIIWINSRNVKVTQNAIINSRWLPPHLHNETAEFGRCELGLVFLLGNDGPFIDEMQLNVGIGSVLVSPTTKNSSHHISYPSTIVMESTVFQKISATFKHRS